MAEQATVTMTFPKWTLVDEDAMEQCQRELWNDYHIATAKELGLAEFNPERPRLVLRNTPGQPTAEIGYIVFILNGVPEALTAEQFASRGLNNTPDP